MKVIVLKKYSLYNFYFFLPIPLKEKVYVAMRLKRHLKWETEQEKLTYFCTIILDEDKVSAKGL